MINITGDIIALVKKTLDPTDIWEIQELAKLVAESLSPEEVFNRAELENWAESDGYVAEESIE